MRVKKFVGVFMALALTLVAAVIAVPSAAASAADDQFANRLYVLINDYRQQHALAPLRMNAQMAAASQSWTQQSADIANTGGAGTFVHSPGSYAFHENIVWNMSADDAFNSWVQSAPHRANMLIAGATDVGIGAVQLTAGPNRGTFLATAQFGWSNAPVIAPTAPPVVVPAPVVPPVVPAAVPAAVPEQAPSSPAPAAPAAPVQEPAAPAAPIADEQTAAELAAADEAARQAANQTAALATQAAVDQAAAEAAAQAAADRAATEAAAQAAVDRAATEAAAQAAAEAAAVPAAAATPAAARGKSRAMQVSESPGLSPLEQVVLGDESLLTAASRGGVTANAAGSRLSISGLQPGTAVEAVIPAAGVNLGTMRTDAAGVLRVSVPPVLSAGEHKVALFRDGSLSGWASFTVEPAVSVLAAQQVPAGAGAELAVTGLHPAQMAIGGIGTLMALVGAAALIAVQRQRSVSAR